MNGTEPGAGWEKFSRYSNMFFLKGNMMNFQDLYNTAIKDCYSVLILSSTNTQTSTPDYDVILLTKLIEYSFPHVRITVELIDKTFIRFMSSKPCRKYQSMPYALWPNSVSGKVYFSSHLDSFICQTYYNPDLLDVMLRIMGITKNNNPRKYIEENSIIRTIKVPKFYYEGKDTPLMYGEVFRDLLHLKPPVIPLGILSRRFTDDDNMNPEEIEEMMKIDQPIVFTNPLPNTHVGRKDKIICIGEPKEEQFVHNQFYGEEMNGATYDGVMRSGIADIMIKGKNQNLNLGVEESIAEEKEAIEYLMNILKKRMESTTRLQRNIEHKNKTIQTLQKEADELKERLIRQHTG